MSDKSGLAAVHDAAGSVSKADHDAAVEKARAEGIATGKAEGEKAGREAGAKAERERLAGIDAHALKGHEKLIAECKADPACTPDMAAGRILAAEKALRANQAAGIAAVEEQTGKVGAAAASDRRREDVPAGQGGSKATTPEGWAAEYKASAQLQAEYPSEAVYVAAMKAELGGKVRYLKQR